MMFMTLWTKFRRVVSKVPAERANTVYNPLLIKLMQVITKLNTWCQRVSKSVEQVAHVMPPQSSV